MRWPKPSLPKWYYLHICLLWWKGQVISKGEALEQLLQWLLAVVWPLWHCGVPFQSKDIGACQSSNFPQPLCIFDLPSCIPHLITAAWLLNMPPINLSWIIGNPKLAIREAGPKVANNQTENMATGTSIGRNSQMLVLATFFIIRVWLGGTAPIYSADNWDSSGTTFLNYSGHFTSKQRWIKWPHAQKQYHTIKLLRQNQRNIGSTFATCSHQKHRNSHLGLKCNW